LSDASWCRYLFRISVSCLYFSHVVHIETADCSYDSVWRFFRYQYFYDVGEANPIKCLGQIDEADICWGVNFELLSLLLILNLSWKRKMIVSTFLHKNNNSVRFLG